MRVSSIACITTALLLACGVVSRAAAQGSTVPPAHVSAVDGAATLERNGEAEQVVLNMPVVEGDRVRTSAGKVQILFPDGSAVDLDPDSDVEYLGGARIRIYAGTVENHPAIVLRSQSASQSAEYLPTDSQAYAADLDQNGSWQYDTSYGNVWYPTVSADWRPYYYGYWTSVPAYGWTWVGYNRWAWPTHHYGRWGYAHSRWFWIPGNVYSSAWVSWGTAPGYVSWCPLGYDSRPVAALSVGYSHGWNPWTIVPRDHFGWRGYPAHRYAVEPYRIAASTPFIVQRNQPSIAVAGARSPAAVSRSGSNGAERSGFNRTGADFGRTSTSSFSRATPITAVPRGSATNDRATSPTYRLPPASSSDRRPSVSSSPVSRGPAQPLSAPGASRPTAPDRAPQAARPTYQPTPPSGSRTMERGVPRNDTFSRGVAPSAPSVDRRPIERAPARTESPRSPSVSRAPAPSASQKSGGGGHVTSAPHAERGPSGGSHGGGSHSSGSQGTAVRRPR